MCKVMEDMRNETARATLISNIRTLMETLKFTSEQAMDALRVSPEERIIISKVL